MPETDRKTVVADFRESYWDLYAGRKDVVLRSLEELADGPGAKLTLHTGLPGFSHFEYSCDGGPYGKAAGGEVLVRLEEKPERQSRAVTVRAVDGKGAPLKTFDVNVEYYPVEFYEASGLSGYPNYLCVKCAEFRFASAAVDDWILDEPTPEEREYAAGKWGALIAGADTDCEKARLLARTLIDDFEGRRGNPSDELEALRPLDQYKRIIAGEGRGWCTQYALIFVAACGALGIPARRVHMERVVSVSDRCTIQIGGKHSSTEFFSGELDRWVWLDLSFYTLGAYLGEEGPLNLAEFHLNLSQEDRKKHLNILLYDPESRSERLAHFSECPKEFNCFYQSHEFHYDRRGG